jgi:hypothetical protein
MRDRIPTLFGSWLLACASCGGGGSPDDPGEGEGESEGEGTFSVDPPMALVNTPTLAITGDKPAGFGVALDGVEAVAAGPATDWSVDASLAEGKNALAFSPIDADGAHGAAVTVTVVLDTVAPAVNTASLSPAADATGVPLNAIVSAGFSEAIDCASVNPTTLVVSGGVGGALDCTNPSGFGALAFSPGANLDAGTSYGVTVLPEVRDLAGNPMAAVFSWSFTTGSLVDTTPPADPTITSPIPTPTTIATINVSGTKEAQSALDARYLLDGVEQNGYQQVVALDGSTAWSAGFALQDGTNQYVLRARDAAGNTSCDDGATPCTVSFIVVKTPSGASVNPPTVSFIPATDAPEQVIFGTKDADTGITIDGITVVAVDGATTWDHEVALSPGVNNLSVRAVDATSALSDPVDVAITYTPGAAVDPSGEVKIELEIQDAWAYVGDEFRITNCGAEVNHLSIEVWVEGPIATTSVTADYPNGHEPCRFDEAAFSRKYTRYVRTLNRNIEGNAMGMAQWEVWVYPNYTVPNYLAALIESGIFEGLGPHSVARDVDRRDANGNTWTWQNGDPPVPCPPLHYASTDGSGNPICSRSLQDLTMDPCGSQNCTNGLIDGVTAASINPKYDKATGLAMDGSALGEWKQLLEYRWDLTDAGGVPLPRGTYLLTVQVTLDRSAANQAPGGTNDTGAAAVAPYQWLDVLAIDHETCWDRTDHATQGAHRAEGLLTLDDTAEVLFWSEKGHAETVDVAHNERDGVRFSGGGGAGGGACDWDGDSGTFCGPNNVDTYANAPHCDEPATLIGQDVRYLVQDQSARGWSGPVRIEYCPTSACP